MGRALSLHLKRGGYSVRSALREATANTSGDVVSVGNISGRTDWLAALKGVDFVVHLAGIAHRPYGSVSAETFREVNTEGTASLASACVRRSVKRIVFVSTVKVFGDKSEPGKPFTKESPLYPEDDYGRSKRDAETELVDLCRGTGTEYTIFRPPLMYGPGVKANFRKLMSAVDKGLPLPFRNANNRRSILYVQNFCDLIATRLEHPEAANRVFLPSDSTDLSTADLVECIATAMGKKPRLFSFPRSALVSVSGVVGRAEVVSRLLDSLQVSDNELKGILGWEPPCSTADGVATTVADYRESDGRTS